MSTTKPNATYVAVDPKTAERWLGGNTVNRKVRSTRVAQYARDMTSGRWQLSNDAIAFDASGKLLNGQHRLNAVIKSGQTIMFLVARNMESDSMTTMDSGVARTASDALHFAGEEHTHQLAAVAKQCILVADGRIYRDNKVQRVSHSEILDFIETNPDVRQSVKETLPFSRGVDAPPSALSVAHWLIARANDYTYATYYISQLASRANEPEGSAVLAVDSRLRELRRGYAKLPFRNYVYLLLKGWNYYARGETVRLLTAQPKPGSEFRIPEPVKWSLP